MARYDSRGWGWLRRHLLHRVSCFKCVCLCVHSSNSPAPSWVPAVPLLLRRPCSNKHPCNSNRPCSSNRSVWVEGSCRLCSLAFLRTLLRLARVRVSASHFVFVSLPAFVQPQQVYPQLQQQPPPQQQFQQQPPQYACSGAVLY